MADLGSPVGRVVVTGATGYLGKQVLDALVRRGHDVVGLARSCSEGRDRGDRLVRCDLLDRPQVSDCLESLCPEIVVHCAAVVPGRGASGYDDQAAARQSVRMTDNLVAAGARKVVFTSSMTVYSPSQAMPVREEETLPESLYALAKIEAERNLAGQSDVIGVVMRLPGLFGAPRTTGLVHALCRAFGEGTAPSLPAEPMLWAAMHVDDAADVVARAVSAFPPRSLTVNVGYPLPISITRLVRFLADAAGRTIDYRVHHPDFEMDLGRLSATFGLPNATLEARLLKALRTFAVHPIRKTVMWA